MISSSQIAEWSEEAARKAARQHRTPYVPYNRDEVEGYDRFPFPFIGYYEPKGWERVGYATCDSSGLGDEDEPAWTARRLRQFVIDNLPNNYGYAIIETGQFQVVVAWFKQVEFTKARNVSNWTTTIEEDLDNRR